jgi:1-deoxy-D-xylulose-5-phosphate reductoisomerase
MGDKISIDSSTLMNKCFEIIEAYWLFDKNVYVYHCPTSFCHALCQYKNYYAMFEHKPDMKVHIKQALLKFKNKLPFIKTHNHNHLKLIKNTLPIKWAYDTIKNHDTTLPIILNAADETAINLFKQQKINYLDIIKLISKCVKQFKNHRINNVSDIYNLHNKVNKYLIDFYK